MPTRRNLLAALSAAPLAPLALGATPLNRQKQRRADAPRTGSPNVLFIGVDDLSPRLGCYGDGVAVTPNLDRLAARGTLMQRCYCQQAVCGASRASLLTGCRPGTMVDAWPSAEYPPSVVDEFIPNHPTAPTWFVRHGYHVRLGGKIHHDTEEQLRLEHATGVPLAEKPGPFTDYVLPENMRTLAETELRPIFEAADVPDDAYKDGTLAESAVAALRAHAAGGDDRPLFLGVGFNKPHLPYVAPRRYWDLYDPDAIPPAAAPDEPMNVPGWTTASYELANRYVGKPCAGGRRPDAELARRLRHGYYAATSYTDAQIGRILDALEETHLAGDTLVILWVDHGFHLGDNGMWGKHVNYEVATRVPLILAGPGVPAGRRPDALVENLDIYPTLCDYAGVEPPGWLEGRSLRGIVDGQAPPTESQAAFSQYPRATAAGHAIRTPRWRYVEWRATKPDPNAPGVAVGDVRERELYDHDADPLETVNIAADRPEVVAELTRRLAGHFGPEIG